MEKILTPQTPSAEMGRDNDKALKVVNVMK